MTEEKILSEEDSKILAERMFQISSVCQHFSGLLLEKGKLIITNHMLWEETQLQDIKRICDSNLKELKMSVDMLNEQMLRIAMVRIETVNMNCISKDDPIELVELETDQPDHDPLYEAITVQDECAEEAEMYLQDRLLHYSELVDTVAYPLIYPVADGYNVAMRKIYKIISWRTVTKEDYESKMQLIQAWDDASNQ